MSVAFLLSDYLRDECDVARDIADCRTIELRRETARLRRMHRETIDVDTFDRRVARIRAINDDIAECRDNIASFDEAIRLLTHGT